MNCFATLKSKIICARNGKKNYVCAVKICSVNLDHENNFLTLPTYIANIFSVSGESQL